MNLDPHGYNELFNTLTHIEERLRALGKLKSAERINFAVRFYGAGSPTEFLGESRLALQAIQNDERDLSGSIAIDVREALEKINEGFRRAGYQ